VAVNKESNNTLRAEAEALLLGSAKSRSGRRGGISTTRTASDKEKLAAHMRMFPTKHESWVWLILVKAGIHEEFQRQPVIFGYIPDFAHSGLRSDGKRCVPFIIEVDGRSHDGRKAAQYDAKRDLVFRNAGYAILRVHNDRATADPKAVLDVVMKLRDRLILDLAEVTAKRTKPQNAVIRLKRESQPMPGARAISPKRKPQP